MRLIRLALIKVLQASAIGALALGIVACFLISYSYMSGDRQDRAEMVATAEKAVGLITVKSRGHSPASLASEH